MTRLALFVAACAAGVLPGQDLAWERTGDPNVSQVGDQLRSIGDVDGDGYRDLLTRAVRLVDAGTTAYFEEELWILSGRDGSTLRVRPRYGPNWHYSEWGGAGDADGDGYPDLVFAAWENQGPGVVVEVRSARDDRLILQIQSNPTEGWGAPLLASRDLDGDGRPDIVAMGGGRQGFIRAHNHLGQLLYRWDSTPQLTLGLGGRRGNNMDWVGDVDGDGTDDFVLGGIDNVRGVTVALVLSGRDGTVIVQGASAVPTEVLGTVVSGCGDVDLDGVPDFAASSNGQLFDQGLVQVFSGRTGQTLRMWTGDRSGQHLRSGDFDRDGIPDFAFQQLLPWGFNLYRNAYSVYSGRDGALIHRMLGCVPNTTGNCIYNPSGYDVVQQPGSAYPSWTISDSYYGAYASRWPSVGTLTRGRISMFHGFPAGVEPYGTACRGSLPSQPRMGIRDLDGRGVRLQVSNAPPGVPAALLLGLSRTSWNGLPLPLALDSWGFPGCSLHTSIDAVAITATGSSGLGAGFAALDFPLPLRARGQHTAVLHGQWLVLDLSVPGGAATDAHLWRH